MKLKLSDDEREDLIVKKILGISSNGKEAIVTKGLDGRIVEIELEGEEIVAVTTKNTLEELYLSLRQEFPTDTLKHIFGTSGGVNLRQGKKDSILKSLKELLLEYTAEEIIMAAKYEVLSRTNRSKKSNKDELEFMKRLGTWVNDTTNIDAMIERMMADTTLTNPTTNARPRIS